MSEVRRLVRRCGRLLGVPSFHFHPDFARATSWAVKRFRPHVVAVEIPERIEPELAWASSLGAVPVVSYVQGEQGSFYPFVPGDSILEASRAGREYDIPVLGIDLEVAPGGGDLCDPILDLPGPEFAARLGRRYFTVVERSFGLHPADAETLAREAFMARRLAGLLEEHERVLWVGGMAHWRSLCQRLKTRDFDSPHVPVSQAGEFLRMRFSSTALLAMTGRIPYLVASYVHHRAHHDEMTALQALIRAAGEGGNYVATDLARVLTYARNIAATRGVVEIPDLFDLVNSASATMDGSFTARLCELALADSLGGPSDLPELTCRLVSDEIHWRQGEHALQGEPAFLPAGRRFIFTRWVEAASARNDLMRDVPRSEKDDGSATLWKNHPEDVAAFEAFVRFVARAVSQGQAHSTSTSPFACGMADGIDVRETLRHLKDGSVYVREEKRTSDVVREGLIDFTSSSEDGAVLRGRHNGLTRSCGRDACGKVNPSIGWTEEVYRTTGAVSRVEGCQFVQKLPCPGHRFFRELTLFSLDLWNWPRREELPSFYDLVIVPLVDMDGARHDNILGWLRVMFAQMKGKPFAYVSRYVPGPRIVQVAREFGVRLIHHPLEALPRELVEANQSSRQYEVNRAQFEAMTKAYDESRRPWQVRSGP